MKNGSMAVDGGKRCRAEIIQNTRDRATVMCWSFFAAGVIFGNIVAALFG